MSIIITETNRLIIREMTLADAENIYNLNIDPEVTRYTGDEAFKTIDEARNFLANYKDYEKFGLGRWAVIEKETNAAMTRWESLEAARDA